MTKRKNLFDSTVFEDIYTKLSYIEENHKQFGTNSSEKIKCPKYDGVMCKWVGNRKDSYRKHVISKHNNDLSTR